jgi:phosphatidylserine/phosphatidylglycerophosphate/cardiolipin synthase-like enzyme
MRFTSPAAGGIRLFAVSGTNTVSFGIEADDDARRGLLGFAVERIDPVENERYFMRGFKVFPSVIPSPDASTSVSTYDHPIQSLVWDDFTPKPGRRYTYRFHPLAGKPKNLDRSRPVVEIDIETEPLYGGAHDVFFNRGVASSQAYAQRFGNLPPDEQPTTRKRKEALAWLSRDLDDAMLRFIRSARPGSAIRGAFYEFTYAPVLAELREAIDRGVDVQLVVDLKVNEHTAAEEQPDGTTNRMFHESDPRIRNLRAIEGAGITGSALIRREARRSSIAHNKFMVLLTGAGKVPTQVWTGSTNLTDGGVHGQANVGHWIRDRAVARSYLEYWDLLATDPGGRAGDSRATVRARNAAFYTDVGALSPVPALDEIPPGTTPVFSPRKSQAPLDLYVELAARASSLACVTFAFTVPAPFKAALAQNTADGPVCFLLLEKEDRPNSRSTTPFVRLDADNNVYQASGSEIATPLGQWVVETDNRKLGLNSHIAFMHCKFLLHDPLGADPIVVTGSANFSVPSTNDNDENMVIVRGDRRVADIYFTEFNRLFNHYYFRSVVDRTQRRAGAAASAATAGALALAENDRWLEKYAPGTLRTKRVDRFVGMAVD